MLTVKLKPIPETKTFYYNPSSMNDIETFLTAQAVGKVFGIEWSITKDKASSYLFTDHLAQNPISLQESIKTIVRVSDDKEMSCVTLQGRKSNCFPFKMNYDKWIWDEVLKYVTKSIKDEKIFIQMLIRKVNGWQDNLEQNYNDYLNGIELPTSNRIIRNVQYRILDFLKTKESWRGENPKIDFTEQKLMESGFQVSLKVLIYGGNKKSRSSLIQKIKLGLSELNYVNGWMIGATFLKKGFIDGLQFRQFTSGTQVLCVSELIPFFVARKVEPIAEDVEVEVVEPKKEQLKYTTTTSDNILDIFPRGQKVVREDDVNISKKINAAFKKLKLSDKNVVVQKIQHGATVCKITFSLPETLTLTKLQNATLNIQTELALKDIGFEQGDLPGTAVMNLPQTIRERVFLRDCIDDEDYKKFLEKSALPFVLGVDTNGKVLFEDLSRIKHLLIVGMTGGGKSVFANLLLTSILLFRSPKEVQMLLIDPKMVELTPYEKFPHTIGLLTDPNKSLIALKNMVVKMNERYELMAKAGCKNIQQYNQKCKDKFPYIIVVIDELADLIMNNGDIEEPIVMLAQKARAAGIHLVIATQRPVKEIVTGLIKGNIYSRVCFLCDSSVSYRVALDEVPKGFTLLGRGDGVTRFEGQTGLNRFQSALIGNDDDEQDKIIEQLSMHWKGDFKKEKLDISDEIIEKEESELDKLKKVIAETGESRFGELKKLMGIRAERLKEHIDELVKQGWLSPPKMKSKGYELLLSDEDRRKYLAK